MAGSLTADAEVTCGNDSAPQRVRVPAALSGGGSRAAAFHLGCLRALHDRDLLDHVRVVSGISGGSLLAALWAYGPTDFADFDASTTDLLRSGLQRDIARQAFTPSAVVRNLAAATCAGARGLLSRTSSVSVARPANRTDALATVLTHKAFGTRTMADVTHPGLDIVLTATDLATTNAVRFGSARSGCSRYGTITEPINVATAVAASAAYPALLPALDRTFTFQHRDGHHQQHTVLLTDGGVYDNLGLSVLEPGRSPHHTQHVYDVPFIISCDAGMGELTVKAPHFMLGRLSRSFTTVHRKAQDSARTRLHEWAASGRIDGFALAYLGMKDDRLPAPPPTSSRAALSLPTRPISPPWP
ncbi:patatin-like phospholipase family protein [Actinacidiphila sp. ITFR-21]|uniref:patatin-like phospholipase family protein n=1 Tax=Actinacidiphila sp. ITFR-21 TaxID=3075199 RepID=UPI00288B8428|nr:patatin-like phospholipase family protein [Streptomyces sp. ITFR-21]WNI14074.1 patatin-like phospholipase family protein [Streptomyces sp. ITFR-21]